MEDFTIKGVVEPVVPQAVDPRRAVLDGILEKFKANTGKWVEIGVAGDTPEVKKRKVRGLRSLIIKLSKIDPVYGAIALRLSKANGQLNLYARRRYAGRRSKQNNNKPDSSKISSVI